MISSGRILDGVIKYHCGLLPFCWQSIIEEARDAINAAHVEAESVQNGIGVVKLMGCDSKLVS
jgi:hypothetical protein